jgi:DNA-binding GntR family transcriptional regulator
MLNAYAAAPYTRLMRSAAASEPTVTDGVRQTLEQDILTGRLPPGSTLDVKAVAERFGISRTPAKEALLQLAAGGLISLQARRGAVVIQLDARTVISMLEVLALLEAEAARLSARRMSAAQREQLARVHDEAGEAMARGDAALYGELNATLHRMVYEGAGNAFLHQQVLHLRGRLVAYRPALFERPGRMKASHREHAAVVGAIVRGDEPEAFEAMTRHITVGGTAQVELMMKLSA